MNRETTTSPETNREKLLQLARRFRFEDSDELPEEIIHSGNYKCRTTFWQGLRGLLRVCIEDGFLDQAVSKKAKSFVHHIENEMDFTPLTRRTPQDITDANRILNMIIEQLDSSLERGRENSSFSV